jgi:molybdopterin converting factor small subunit
MQIKGRTYMTVSIKLSGMQQVIAGAKVVEMPVTGYSTVRDALEFIKKNYPQLHLESGAMFFLVNHEVATLDKALGASDTIEFIPAIGGG